MGRLSFCVGWDPFERDTVRNQDTVRQAKSKKRDDPRGRRLG